MLFYKEQSFFYYISKISICYETHTEHTNTLCGVKTRVVTAVAFWTFSNHWIFRGLIWQNLWFPNLYSHFGTEFHTKFWHDDSKVKTRISLPYKIRINGSYVYWTVHHLDSWVKRDKFDVTCFIISLFDVQHVSDVNTSILRSLRLICWVISWVVLLWFDVCWCYVVVWLWWCGIRMQAST